MIDFYSQKKKHFVSPIVPSDKLARSDRHDFDLTRSFVTIRRISRGTDKRKEFPLVPGDKSIPNRFVSRNAHYSFHERKNSGKSDSRDTGKEVVRMICHRYSSS